MNTISEIVTDMADPACNIIFGAVVNDAACAQDEIHVTIIATGFSQAYEDELLSPRGAIAKGAAAPSNYAAPPSPPATGAKPSGTLGWRPTRR